MTVTADHRSSAPTAAGPPTSSYSSSDSSGAEAISPYGVALSDSPDRGRGRAERRARGKKTPNPPQDRPHPPRRRLPPAPVRARVVAGAIDLLAGSLLFGGLTALIWQVAGRPAMFSGLIAFGVVVGLRWLAIAATGWSLGGLLLRIRMLGARKQTPSPLGSFPRTSSWPSASPLSAWAPSLSCARRPPTPKGVGGTTSSPGWRCFTPARRSDPTGPPSRQPSRGAGPRASPPPGPRQGPPLRKDPSPRTPVRLGTLPSAPPSPPRAASRAPRARSPPRHHPRRPLRRRTSPPPAVGAPRGPSGRPRRRRGKPQSAVLERAPHAHGPAIRFRRRVPRPPPWEPRAPQKRES